jgi:predicted Zn finger-like uncharacterized protein
MPQQISCPSCARTLKVPDELIGKTVRCPNCKTAFTAQAEPPSAPLQTEKPPAANPSRRRAADDDPPRDADDADDRPRDDENDQPRSGGAPHKGGLLLGLGITSVVLAALSLLSEGCASSGTCCTLIMCVAWMPLAVSMLMALVGAILGLFASILGHRDLGKMNRGEMDRSGRGSTKGGMICGIVGSVLCVLDLLCGIVILILWIAGIGLAAMGGAGGDVPR